MAIFGLGYALIHPLATSTVYNCPLHQLAAHTLNYSQEDMGSCSKRFDIFEGPDSDRERAKPLKRKQTLKCTRIKRAYKLSSQRIVKQTQSKRKERKQKQSAVTATKSRGGEHGKPRRSARLEAQRFKDAMRTQE